MPKLAYFSVTGQTRRFIAKLPHIESVEITVTNPFIKMDEPFILVVPTYVSEVTEPVNDFLETGENARLCLGLFGGGNRNFADLYCFTVHDLEQQYGLPVLHEFEFQGSDYDVQKLESELDRMSQKTKRVS